MSSVRHFLLTRFNVTLPGYTLDDVWLRHRTELFEEVCVPSVNGQMLRDFVWLVLLSPSSPQWIIDRVPSWLEECPRMKPVFCEVRPVRGVDRDRVRCVREVVVEEIQKELRLSWAEKVITSRLDNDDAITRDFMITAQEKLKSEKDGTFLNFQVGLMLGPKGLYFGRDPKGHFCSVIERSNDLQTIFVDGHRRLDRYGRVVQVTDQVHWLEMIHDFNVANFSFGKKVRAPLKVLTKHFAFNPGRVLEIGKGR